MSMISEQVKKMREYADIICNTYPISENNHQILVLLREAADTIEALSAKVSAANMERSDRYYNGGWTECSLENLPDKEVLCCDKYGEMILGYVFGDMQSETEFSAENDHEYMYNCVKWMEKPKA